MRFLTFLECSSASRCDGKMTPESPGCDPPLDYGIGRSITAWYLRMFLVRSRSYSVLIGGSDTINGVSGRFRYVLPYLRMFLEGVRSHRVIA